MSPRRRLDRRTRQQLTVFAALLAVSVLLMGLSATFVARKIQNVFNYAMDPVVIWINDSADTLGSVWGTLGGLDRLRQENDALRQENDTLRQELARMPAISRLNEDWTKITQTQQSIPYQSLRARVLVRVLSDVDPRIFVIDKGSRDGIRVGEVVVTNGKALVGRIDKVQDATSTVQLLDDTTSVVIGREESTGAIGTVRGQVGGLLEMAFVPVSEKLENGQIVMTAGESVSGSDIRSPYPPALLIGTVSKVSHDANAEFQSAILTPAAEMDSIVFVLVITDYEGGLPLPSPSASGDVPSPTPTATPSPTPSPSPSPTPRKGG